MTNNQASAGFEYGPIDVYVVEFEGEGLAPTVLDALLELSATGTVRVVDLVVVTRMSDGEVRVTELREDAANALSGIGLDLEIEGLIGEEDIAESIAGVAPGFGVALAAIEMRWATALASRLAAAQGRVVRTERVPAPLVNELVAASLAADEGA
ncbi:DUF6325 family protein [Microbacterium sp. A82]|uniref:DUF6325 family protein n=1 Tax=unclassified Microbacterium TaxID=2609290 RepID=UPI003F33F21A